MLKKLVFLSLILGFVLFAGCEKPVELPDGLYARLSTSKGTIILKLDYEKVPMTVANFVGLAEGTLNPGGKPFYNGNSFHRVVKNFVIQAGAPPAGAPSSPGYHFPDEFDSSLRHDRAGILSMANSGPHTNSSQFFITHKPAGHLDDHHSVFGSVVAGQEVVDVIDQGDKIKKVEILRIGPAAEAFVVTRESFDVYVRQAEEKIAAAERAAEEEELRQEALLNQPVDSARLSDGLYAVMKTNKGTIVLQLEFQKVPLTVANFVGLAEGTLEAPTREAERYYDGLTFHRVEPDFVIQGGDPNGNGTGGPGYSFPDEFDASLRHDRPGILSMANSGPDTNGSQFFITHKATPWLDDRHAVFGHVVEGMEVVNAIVKGDVIRAVEILRIGNEARAFQVDQQKFEQLKAAVQAERQQASSRRKTEEARILETRYPNARKTASGLRYIVEEEGSGTTSPAYGTQVTVHYRGMFVDGEVFDSSYSRNSPSQFQIGQVIEGWNEALQLMHKGAKWTLIIPPELGYGAAGYGSIPGNAHLIFEVELIDF